MNSQRVSNDLNLALDVSNEVRKKTIDLEVGYDQEVNTWEVIVKYSGDLSIIREELGVIVTELLNEYAIITVPEPLINRLLEYQEIEFIEKPKRLFFSVNGGKAASCINPLQSARYDLFGEGVLAAVIDSGIDYAHPDFRNEDGTTRILDLWDQTIEGNPPSGYFAGTLYTEEKINEALSKRLKAEQLEIVPSVDISGHGTHVTGILAGNGRASNGRYKGVASKSNLLIVKLGSSRGNSFPRTTRLMEAIDYVVKRSLELHRPLVINISFGNNYGSHDGNSLLETYMDSMAGLGRNSIVVGTGNEGGTGHHTSGRLKVNQNMDIELAVSVNEPSLNLQIWKNYFDDFGIEVISPGGRSSGIITQVLGTQRFPLSQTIIYLYYGEPTPSNIGQEIYFEFVAANKFVEAGIWLVRLVPKRIIVGDYHMWLPTGEVISPATKFLRPTEDTTLTIPSTARRVISVGGYDAYTDSFAYFSGRGYPRGGQNVKPDLVAPGVNIMSASPGGGYTMRTGTSMATPFVSGGAALLMEWGILEGNDPYLYGEKMKAYLINGARQLPGFEGFPNSLVGWGALCLRDSLPL